MTGLLGKIRRGMLQIAEAGDYMSDQALTIVKCAMFGAGFKQSVLEVPFVVGPRLPIRGNHKNGFVKK